MKRGICLLAAALLTGCSNDGNSTSTDQSKPMETKSASATIAGTAKPKPMYFELNRGGKTYVFGHVATMQNVARGESVPNLKEMPGPSGETVVVETGEGMETRLMEEYAKAHPKK